MRPFTAPDGSGQVQELIRRAAAGQGIAIVNSTAPRQRCTAQLQHGDVDAVEAGFVPDRLACGAYPMHAGRPDNARVLAVARFMVYRRSGSTPDWELRKPWQAPGYQQYLSQPPPATIPTTPASGTR